MEENKIEETTQAVTETAAIEVAETVELTDAEKLIAGSAALKNIDEKLFATEIKTIDAKQSALEKKEEVKTWWNEHKQDIVNGVILVALAYVIFRVTL